MDPEEGGEPEVKRKKTYTKKEILEKLEECENDGKEKIGGSAKKYILGRKQHFWAQKGTLWAIGAEK